MTNIFIGLHIYFVMAIMYNVFSHCWLDIFKRQFAPTDPKTGIMTVAVVYLVFLLHGIIPHYAELFLLFIFTLLILRFGVLHHMKHYDKDDYLSRFTWVLAILINMIGVVLLFTYIFANLVYG